MRIEGVYQFKADRETVWAALQAPDVLSRCIPGCQRLEQAGQNTYDVVLKVGVAAITGAYTGRVSIDDIVHPDSYRMAVEGKGTGGTVKGDALLTFVETDGGTEVKVAGDAQVTGVVARVGQRLMGSTSTMLMNRFFSCMKAEIEG